jgi:hypothetical protein
MSSFCGGTGSIPAMTVQELRQVFQGANQQPGILPDTMPPMPSGLAEETWVRQYVQTLESQGRIPKPPRAADTQSAQFNAPETKQPLAQFVEKENVLQDTIKAEYCFYESRYFAALDSFLSAVSDASLRGQAQTQVQSRLDLARMLNQKLTLLTQITNGISKYRYSASSMFQNDINSLNTNMRARQEDLRKQSEILQRESAAADVNKRMVQYTVEKNKANSNLLTLYGILNITALAMIFYIARS